MNEKPTTEIGKTDLTRWRLHVNEGRHNWRYFTTEACKNRPQSLAERYFLGLPTDFPFLPRATTPQQAAESGLTFLKSLQLADGHWGCEYGGPCFLTPGLVFAMYIAETEIPEEWKMEISRHIIEIQRKDGGWGLHAEDPSTVLATGLNYVTLRILGIRSDHNVFLLARECLNRLGGIKGIPQWGKIWFCLLNLYPWEGINPVPSEFWLLPDWVPVHPWRWWIHCRVMYLPTSYLSSRRFQMLLNPLLEELRAELYSEPYGSIEFTNNRNNVAVSDLKTPHSALLKVANYALSLWESYIRPRRLQEPADKRVQELIKREDENTGYNCLAPVNKAMHMVAIYASEGRDSSRLQLHRERIGEYFWMGKTGITSGGTNGAQVWDTTFIVQAGLEAGLVGRPEFRETFQRALEFLKVSQLEDDLDDPYRQPRKGGWPFSTKDNGYIVSDCSAEALKCVLALQEEEGFDKIIPYKRLCDCVDTLLKMQNPNGGFGTYETTRGPAALLELLNPAEIFSSIMVEHSYVECSTAVLTAFKAFSKHYPAYRRAELDKSMNKALEFIRKEQRPDGSWYGSWGVCFTYAAQFALEALKEGDETYANSDAVRRGCEFLVKRQREDGGWGEHWSSCELEKYVQAEESQAVNTAWAVIALMHAGYPGKEVVERGIWLLMKRQRENGEWEQGAVEGVFNKTCMIGYPNYRLCFPVKALGMYGRIYGEIKEKVG